MTGIELQPPGFNDGPMDAGSPYPQIGVNRFDVITLTPGLQAGLYNFGEYPAALSGYVYRDTNNDGIFQRYASYPNNESGLSNVGITLTFQTITGAVGARTTQTDNYGRYAFTGLVRGVYTISELQPSAYTDGREGIPELPATDSGDMYSGIAYTPGLPGGGFNFGELFASSINVIVFFAGTHRRGFWNLLCFLALRLSFMPSTVRASVLVPTRRLPKRQARRQLRCQLRRVGHGECRRSKTSFPDESHQSEGSIRTESPEMQASCRLL